MFYVKQILTSVIVVVVVVVVVFDSASYTLIPFNSHVVGCIAGDADPDLFLRNLSPEVAIILLLVLFYLKILGWGIVAS